MLNKKKVSCCVLAVLALLTIIIGCSKASPSPEDVTGEVLHERLIAAYQKVHSYQYDMNGSVSITGEGLPLTEDAGTTYRRSAIVDNDNKTSKFTITVKMPSLGQISATGNVEATMYISGDWMYLMPFIEGMPEQWMKGELPEGYWEIIDTIAGEIALLQSSEISITGTEVVDGTDCYVAQVTPDKATIWEAMAKQLPIDPEMEAAIVPEDMLRDISVKYWIAVDNFLLRKTHLQLTALISQVAPGISDEEGTDTAVTMEIKSMFYGYDAPVTIEVPTEALNAPEATGS